MFRSALRPREKLVAETFFVDEIQVHTVCAVSFIDIFRVGGLCVEPMLILGKSLSEPIHAFKKMCAIARTASSRRVIVIWPTTEEPDRITAAERVLPV